MLPAREDVESTTAARIQLPLVRWGALLAGLAGAIAIYLLLALLGVATGVAVPLPGVAPTDGSPLLAAGWLSASFGAAAFVGGYIAAHLTGLARRGDGLAHGFVLWSALFILLASVTALASGPPLNALSGLVTDNTTRPSTELSNLLPGTQHRPDDLAALSAALRAGDRRAAVAAVSDRLGFPAVQAEVITDELLLIFSPATTEAIAIARGNQSLLAWWLTGTLLLGLFTALWGGRSGVRSISERTVGNHIEEREPRRVDRASEPPDR